MLHGRLLAGIAARAVEAELGDAEFQPVRLTIDLFKAAGLDPLTTDVNVTRKGGRVRAAELSIVVGGVEAARASTLLLRIAEPPDNPVPSSPAWTSERPDELPTPEAEAVGFDIRFVPGHAFGAPGVRKAWCRENRPLVDGEALTPFQRAALVGDFTNPFANTGRDGLDFINADVTLYLGRPPEGEWIGVETTEHVAANGTAVSSSRLYDETGPIGTSGAASVLTPRMQKDSSPAAILRRADE
jgi:Acyl-CoA thioesterase C-terminal domain/Acyl-CoA thioesterase N-terminal domain